MAVTGDLGGNPIVLENAAEEATLQRLVDLFESKFADNSGVKKQEAAATKEATKATKSYQDIVDSTSKGMEKYEVKLTSFGERLDKTSQQIKAVGGSLTNSFKALGESGENMGGALGAITGPVGGSLNALGIAGKIAGGALTGFSFVAGLAMGAFDKSVKTFQQLTLAGATFGGDMIAMRMAAGNAGVTVTQFADAVSKNIGGLADFGGTATQGAQILSQVTAAGKASSNELFRLGIAAKDQPEFFAQFISDLSTSGRSLNTFGGDFTRIAAVAVKYRKDLQALQEITGQTREEQEAALKAQKQDAAFQALLADMDVEQAKSLEGLMASMSPLEQQMLKQQMTIGSFTGETAAAASQMPGVAGRVMDVVNALQNGESDMAGAYARSSQQRAQELRQDAATAREYAKMSAFTNNILTKIGVENSIFLTKQQERNAEMEKNLATVRAQQATEQENANLAAQRSEAMAKIQVAFERLGNKLIDLGIVDKLVEALTFVADNIDGIAKFLVSQDPKTLIIGGLTALFAGPAVLTAMKGGVTGLMGKIGSKMMGGLAGGGGAEAMGGVGKGVGAGIKGVSSGLASLANPKVLLGLGGVVLAIMGIAKAAQIAAPAFEPLGKMFKSVFEGLAPLVKEVFNGIGTFVDSVGGSIKGVIEGIGNSIASVVDSITNMKTAGVDATTEQIERLSSIPSDQLINAAAGIERMKAALDGFSPGVMGGISQGLGSFFGGDQADKITRLAEAGAKLQAATSILDMTKFDLTTGIEDRYKAFAREVERVAEATEDLQMPAGALAATAGQGGGGAGGGGIEHTALLQRLLDVQTRQGTETNDLLRRISNEI